MFDAGPPAAHRRPAPEFRPAGKATFPVRLGAPPSQAVTVSVSSQDPSEFAASPSSLTFSTTNWHTNQTVTVTGADDAPSWNVRLDPPSGDSSYNALSNLDIAVTTTDDAVVAVIVDFAARRHVEPLADAGALAGAARPHDPAGLGGKDVVVPGFAAQEGVETPFGEAEAVGGAVSK